MGCRYRGPSTLMRLASAQVGKSLLSAGRESHLLGALAGDGSGLLTTFGLVAFEGASIEAARALVAALAAWWFEFVGQRSKRDH